METINPAIWLAGEARQLNEDLAVLDKATGEVLARTSSCPSALITEAFTQAEGARAAMAALSTGARERALQSIAAGLERESESFAQLLSAEVGKPIRDARGEVQRSVETLRIAAAEATRMHGETIAFDASARGQQHFGFWARKPIGVCSFIAPFNFPLNLAIHKIAPAIAAGCPFVLKPASWTPLSALALGSHLQAAGLPKGAFSILPCSRTDAGPFSEDPRIKLLSFTGSPDVGWALKRAAHKAKVTLELGGNAAAIVHEDADLDDALDRLMVGIYAQSGQSCISVQRVLIHAKVYDQVKGALVHRSEALVIGDPKDEKTDIGPLIQEREAIRLQAATEEAIARGARLLCGGTRQGSTFLPTLLESVPDDSPLSEAEAFGPIAILEPYEDLAAAFARVNASRFGLQAGLFTKDLNLALQAFDALEVGGLMVNEVPTFRADAMPYGGVKDSGLGREGPRFAIEDMTEIRVLGIRRRP